MNLKDELKQRLAEMPVAATDAAIEALVAYVALLAKWNRVYNLTAVREPQQMLYQHLLDSLAVLPWISGGQLLDVGSGGGLPGIPLAIVRPDLMVTLLDSNHKKATFMQQAAVELGLRNVTVCCERVEQAAGRYDRVISRAFSDLEEFVRLSRHLVTPGGRLLAMKGIYPYDEMTLLPDGAMVEEVVSLDVPGLDAQRHLVILKAT